MRGAGGGGALGLVILGKWLPRPFCFGCLSWVAEFHPCVSSGRAGDSSSPWVSSVQDCLCGCKCLGWCLQLSPSYKVEGLWRHVSSHVFLFTGDLVFVGSKGSVPLKATHFPWIPHFYCNVVLQTARLCVLLVLKPCLWCVSSPSLRTTYILVTHLPICHTFSFNYSRK
jgi:hypothetical protein